MKYLKTYESNRKYKVHDLVIVLSNNDMAEVAYKHQNNKYVLYSLDRKKGVYELYPRFFRRATEKEIQEYKIKKDVEKYNI